MSDAFALFGTEVRRCLSRRLVWVLVGVAFVAVVAMAVIVFASTGHGPGIEGPRPRLVDVWPDNRTGGDRLLGVTVVFLSIGGLLGGASMVGAEWRAGSIATLLTWEPRRVRLAVARFAAVAVCAFAIAFVLQVAFVLGLLPAVLAHGATQGVDGPWFHGLLAGMVRSECLVAMVAVFGAAVAMVGRNTAAALGASFAYMLIGENIVRAWKPWLRPWLIAENAVTFLLGYAPDGLGTGRGFGKAAATLVLYTVGVSVVAVAAFRLRDVSSA